MTLDTYETALLASLRAHIAAHAPKKSRRAIPIVSSIATACVGAVAAVVLWPTAAWAVGTEPNGDVTVTFNRYEDAEGLDAALADVGITAEVTFWADPDNLPDGIEELPDLTVPLTPECAAISGFASALGSDGGSITIPAAGVGSGATLYIVHGGRSVDPNDLPPDSVLLESIEEGNTITTITDVWWRYWWQGGPCA
jgi:hypothetical protein